MLAGAAAALCLLLVSQPARAAELHWSAPEGCPDRALIEAKIERLIGRPLAEVRRLAFEVQLSGGGDRWSMRMQQVQGGSPGPEALGERTIEGASCAEVSEAAAVAIAMAALESDAAAADEAPASSAPSRGPTRAEAASEPATEAPESAAPFRFGAGAGVALDGGALPSPAVGAQLELFAGYGALRAILLGTLFASQTAELAGGAQGAEFQLTLGALLLCAEGEPSSLRLLGCGGFELGELSGQGLLDEARSGASGWRALRGEVGLGFELGQGIALSGRVGAVVPLVRQPFVVNGRERLHRAGSVTARASVGLELHL